MSTLQSVPTSPRPTLPAQVARHLLDLISRERLKPGDTAPSEVQICKQLGVSRGSVREAYRTLSALGILEIESGRRPRLQAMSAHVLAQVFGYALNTAQVNATHVIETRRAIEVQGAQLAARHASDAQKRCLQEQLQQMRAALNDHDHARRMAADIAIHTTLAEASLNPLNSLLLAALREPLEHLLHINLDRRRSDEELRRIVDAHEAIVDRVCSGDAVGAGAAMAMHFDLSVAALSRVEQTMSGGLGSVDDAIG
ncbi:MAG TPA: FCD domain-containing protein [Steroidobacter sp.]|uniref:FadR/GntR family transcriptional regulator n=1 Tax=Steroidobacter sp. TaxID=1978227 RepID=UPI002ED92C38